MERGEWPRVVTRGGRGDEGLRGALLSLSLSLSQPAETSRTSDPLDIMELQEVGVQISHELLTAPTHLQGLGGSHDLGTPRSY